MSSTASPAEGVPRKRRRWVRLHLAAALLVIVALLASGFYWSRLMDGQNHLRQETINQIGQRAAQLADAVAGQTGLLIRLVDFAVHHLRDDYVGGDRRAFDATVRTILEAFPAGAVLQVGVIDAQGYLIYSNLGVRDRVYLGDREHFKAHLGADPDRLFISKPVFGRVSNTWSIQFSRPIRRQGEFLGVLVLSVAPEYVARSLALPDLGADDVIALFREDGTYLSRNRDLIGALGKAAPADRPFIGPGAPRHGKFRAVAAFDQIPRTYAWSRPDDVPVVVNVGIGEAVVLGPVEESIDRERERNLGGIAVVLLLAIGIAGLLVAIAARQRVMAESENRYRSFFENNAAVKLLIDPADGRIADANAAAIAYYGHSRDKLLSMRIGEINCLPPDQVKAEMARAAAEQRQYFVFPHRLASGEVRHVEVYSGPIDLNGRRLLFSIIHDITARRELEESQRLAQSVFDAASEAIMVTDAGNRIVAVNPAFSRITGYLPQEVLGRNPSLLASGQHDVVFYRGLWQRLLQDGHWQGEISNRRKDGRVYVEWLKIAVVRDEDGQPRRYVALFSDVTERKRHEDAVWHQANFDTLTGLPNRQLLDDRLDRALAQAGRRHAQVAVLFIDLDRFKPVNDNYGHGTGDELLRQVARRLEQTLRDEDTVARLGGDEFVAVLPDLVAGDAPVRAAEKLIAALSAPFRVGEHYLEISCSVGIAIYPRDAVDAAGLIEKADVAMYRAKDAGRSIWSLA
jgi:diguanylate cyclase (GGDEF)-like protein/PAS domain S-box-containing protein